ncbi:hypothetical protein BC830DRAFT_1086199 [Chytriomyces sp. MP71]|nr:hypothetical protein BC830DRAFT_1086199 [Chytriomyces sp. MP71]
MGACGSREVTGVVDADSNLQQSTPKLDDFELLLAKAIAAKECNHSWTIFSETGSEVIEDANNTTLPLALAGTHTGQQKLHKQCQPKNQKLFSFSKTWNFIHAFHSKKSAKKETNEHTKGKPFDRTKAFPSKLLKNYQLGKKLGEGGSGVITVATRLKDQKQVAIKSIDHATIPH